MCFNIYIYIYICSWLFGELIYKTMNYLVILQYDNMTRIVDLHCLGLGQDMPSAPVGFLSVGCGRWWLGLTLFASLRNHISSVIVDSLFLYFVTSDSSACVFLLVVYYRKLGHVFQPSGR